MNRQIVWLLACLLNFAVLNFAVLNLTVAAQAEEKGSPTFNLTAQPTAEPFPSLKYQFIPSMLDQTPGNAALFYMKAAMLLGQGEQHHKNMDQVSQWLDKPLAELPRDAVRKMLESYQGPLHEVELGAKRETCDWELPVREGDPFSITLEEIQRARQLGQLLALRARLQIAEGRIDEAISTLRTACSLARHVGQQPTLVSGLVAMAIIHGPVVRQLETLIETPAAPNLYWALTSLPAPTLDFRPAVQFEINGVELTFPDLQNVENSSRSEAEWKTLYEGIIRKIKALTDAAEDKANLDRINDPAWQAKADPLARDYLAKHGFAKDKVAEMYRPQALIVATTIHYRQGRDAIFRWFYVPYWQAQAGLKAAERELLDDKLEFDLLPLRSMIPAMAKVSFSVARLDRRIAALRIVEALRLHAAANGGKLPAHLNDVTLVAIPLDPVLGRPFDYQVDGDTATISAAPPSDMSAEFGGLKYVLKLAKPGP